MKLFYSKGSCALAIRIVLHELQLDCTFEAVHLGTKKTETGHDYWAINPKGGVPALQLDSGEIITENTVIQQYLADQKPGNAVLPLVGLMRYHVLEWMNFVATDLHKGACAPLFSPHIPENLKQEVFVAQLKNRLDFVARQLGDRHYLVDDLFTLADAYLFVVLYWSHQVFGRWGVVLSDWPALLAYYENLKKRPSVARALAEEGLLG